MRCTWLEKKERCAVDIYSAQMPPNTRAHIYGSHSPAFSLCDPLIEPMGGHNNYGESGGSKILVWIHMYAELPSPKYHNPIIHGPQVQQF